MMELLSKLLKWGEIAALLVMGVAVLLKILNFPLSSNLFLLALSILAVVYFLSANNVMLQNKAETKPGLMDVLVTIVRKVMFIGIAVLCFGYLFAILHLKGANELMLIGLPTLIVCLLISMVLILAKRERMALLQLPLVRSAAALLFYFITPLLS